ncbi:MAG: hypothetical protein KDC98_20980 [Planctomycetes bacterium]|nr:hypothetical protein [Planctomycetota bacterium]
MQQLATAFLPLAALACLISALPGQDTEDPADKAYAEALARYREVKTRLPFNYHLEGRTRLANSRRPEALALLAQDYAKPWSYPQYTRYTIARLIADNFDDEKFVPQIDALRIEHDEPVDMWLWVQALRIQADNVGDATAVEIAANSKNVMHRAAAILALGESRTGHIMQAIVAACLGFPKKEAERCLLLGAMSGALWQNKRYVNDPDYRTALEAYISLLHQDVGLNHVSKIQMARHLQWILRGPALFVNPEPWLELLQRGEIKEVKKTDTRAAPTFFGIETQGERFCYVLDMSDSMCKEIEPSARPSTAPTTGPRPRRKKGFVPTESDLPWHLIKTRWDLAREQLRISLLRLSDDNYFSVIWFGSESGTFNACKGMMPATKGNVDRLLAEIDKVKPGPVDSEKAPDGQLRGKTNLHAGLKLAFGLARKGYVEEAAYVDGKVLTEGCDTIFLLSDGAPSWDDFNIEDKDYGEGQVVLDTEYGKAAPRSERIHYHGPYSRDPHWLVEDVRRMNAFRRIRMHCVGLGEANMSLLRELAKMGNGETYSMGKSADK